MSVEESQQRRATPGTAPVVQEKAEPEPMRRILDCIPAAVVVRRGSTILYANPAFARLFGRAPQASLAGLDVLSLAAPGIRITVREGLERRDAMGGAGEVFEVRHSIEGGGTKVIEVTPGGVIDFEGGPAVVTVLRDVTEARILEEERQRARSELRALVDTLGEGLFIRVGETIVYANPSFARMAGREEPAQLVGESIVSLVAEQDREQIRERIAKTSAGGQAGRSEMRVLRRNGEAGLLELSQPQPIHFDGRAAHVVVVRDVTEQRAFERRLLIADRMASVGTLAAGVAHEINNPLAYVLANLGFVEEEIRATSAAIPADRAGELIHALEDTRLGAERVRDIVRALKGFSRDDDVERDDVRLHDVVDLAVKMASNEIRHRARLELDLRDVPDVRANPGRLGQVVVNLLVNAAQAIPEGAVETNCVAVRTRTASDGRAILEVSDTGVGMEPAVVDRIFEPFFTTKRVGEGTGLGLFICHGIVTACGGTIEIESEPGRGTTFRVALPPTGRKAPPLVRPGAGAAPEGRPRVLVIDDERLVGSALARLLSGEHDVHVVSDAREGLAQLLSKDEQWDAVICDLMMPELTGMDLYESVRREKPDLAKRIVFITGGAFTPRARDFVASLENPTIAKPFEPDDVRAVIAAISGVSR